MFYRSVISNGKLSLCINIEAEHLQKEQRQSTWSSYNLMSSGSKEYFTNWKTKLNSIWFRPVSFNLGVYIEQLAICFGSQVVCDVLMLAAEKLWARMCWSPVEVDFEKCRHLVVGGWNSKPKTCKDYEQHLETSIFDGLNHRPEHNIYITNNMLFFGFGKLPKPNSLGYLRMYIGS